jgi:hypothetical protein
MRLLKSMGRRLSMMGWYHLSSLELQREIDVSLERDLRQLRILCDGQNLKFSRTAHNSHKQNTYRRTSLTALETERDVCVLIQYFSNVCNCLIIL